MKRYSVLTLLTAVVLNAACGGSSLAREAAQSAIDDWLVQRASQESNPRVAEAIDAELQKMEAAGQIATDVTYNELLSRFLRDVPKDMVRVTRVRKGSGYKEAVADLDLSHFRWFIDGKEHKTQKPGRAVFLQQADDSWQLTTVEWEAGSDKVRIDVR